MSASESIKSTFIASTWLKHFEENSRQRMFISWERPIIIEPQLRKPLVRSLQRFQVGEQGDGLHLRKAAMKTRDCEYIAAIELFVKEEQEHSRLLARLIEGMDGSLLKYHWSDVCFVLLRRLLGLRMELLVLLVAEIFAQAYYRILYDNITDTVLHTAFAQIVYDEYSHVAFHCAYLHQAFARNSVLTNCLIYKAWQLFYMFVCLIVIYDHRTLFYALGVTPYACLKDCMQTFQAAQIFTSK